MPDPFALLATLDREILLAVNRTLANPLFDILMPILSDKWLGILLTGAALPLLLARGGRRTWGLILALLTAVALADLGANLLKQLFQRLRPCHAVADLRVLAGCTRSFSLPSNHAANMAAVAAGVWLGGRRRSWGLAFALLLGGVMYSRLYLGVHYPSDVLVGALWGAGVGGALACWGRSAWPAGFPAAPPVPAAPAPDLPDASAPPT
jgi:undecaprenyl-diphosphatase